MNAHQLILLLVIGVILAVSLAVCFSTLIGPLRQGYRWLTVACPHCSRRRLRRVADIRQPIPGSLYVCAACERRWFLPGRQRELQDASGPAFDPYFQPPAPPKRSRPRTVGNLPFLPHAWPSQLRTDEQSKSRLVRLLELAASYNDKGIYWRRDSPAQVQQTRREWQQEVDALIVTLGESNLPAELLVALRSGAAVHDDSGRFVEQARRWEFTNQ